MKFVKKSTPKIFSSERPRKGETDSMKYF